MTPWILNGKVLVDKFGRPILCDECPCDEKICCVINMDRSRLTGDSPTVCPLDETEAKANHCFEPPGFTGPKSSVHIDENYVGEDILQCTTSTAFTGSARDIYRVRQPNSSAPFDTGIVVLTPKDYLNLGNPPDNPQGVDAEIDWFVEAWFDNSSVPGPDGFGNFIYLTMGNFDGTQQSGNAYLEVEIRPQDDIIGKVRYSDTNISPQVHRNIFFLLEDTPVHHLVLQWTASSRLLMAWENGNERINDTTDDPNFNFPTRIIREGAVWPGGVVIKVQEQGHIDIAQYMYGNHNFTAAEVSSRYDAGVP